MKYNFLLVLILIGNLLISNSYAQKPNIVMVFVDDLHYGALGVTGSVNTRAKTPNIDAIFEEGVRFPNGYATHAVCAPSRAGLLTGRYQARFDYEVLSGKQDLEVIDYGVNTKEIMIPAILKEAGYKSAAFGKWHLGVNEHFQPNARGFDYWFGYRESCAFYQYKSQNDAALAGQEILPPLEGELPRIDVVRNGVQLELPGYLTDIFAEDAAQWIDDNKDGPFFLYFAPYNAHAPDAVPMKYVPEGGTMHDGVIAAMDHAVGVLLSAIEQAGKEDNTIVVFSNDNGGKSIYSTTFNGHKSAYYEGGVRVPFAMRWPAQITPGTEFDGIVSTLDMLPTFTAAAGATLPLDVHYDGQDLMPFINGDKAKEELRDRLFWRNGNWRAVLKDNWKLVWRTDKSKLNALWEQLGIVHEKGRKVVYAERHDSLFKEPELYNLSDDIMESVDLSLTDREQLDLMKAYYRQWEETLPKWRCEVPVYVDSFLTESLNPVWSVNGLTDILKGAAYESAFGLRVRAGSSTELVVNTEEYTGIKVTYMRKTTGLKASQYFEAQWSIDGQIWHDLEPKLEGDNHWRIIEAYLPEEADKQPTLHIRFNIESALRTEQADIDNVKIEGIKEDISTDIKGYDSEVDITSRSELLMFPNPASHTVYIKGDAKDEILRALIYNLNGVKEGEYQVQNEHHTNALPLKDLMPGNYLLCVHLKNKTITKKLVII